MAPRKTQAEKDREARRLKTYRDLAKKKGATLLTKSPVYDKAEIRAGDFVQTDNGIFIGVAMGSADKEGRIKVCVQGGPGIMSGQYASLKASAIKKGLPPPKPIPITAPPIASPVYYQRVNGDCLDVIEQLDLSFSLGNVLKYVWRAGRKPGENEIKDLKKAKDYLNRYIDRLEHEGDIDGED